MVRHDSTMDILSRDTNSFDKAFFSDMNNNGVVDEHDDEEEEEVSEGSQTQDVAKLIRRASVEWSKNHRNADDDGDADADADGDASDGADDAAPSDEHEGENHVAKIVRRASERYMGQQASDETTPVAP